MFIKRIVLNNFKIHKHLDIELDKLNVIVGENGGGKSSILEAICYCLFGTTASGAKKNELIKYGEKTGSVTLVLSNDYTIIKDFNGTTKMLDENNKVISEKVSEIESFLNLNKDIFMNILYGSQNNIYDYFLKFNAKEKDFLDNVFNLDTLTDNISNILLNSKNEFNMRIKEIKTINESKNNLLNMIDKLLRSCNMDNINDLKNAVQIAYTQLQDIKEKQKAFQIRDTLVKNIERCKGTLSKLENDLLNTTNQYDNDNKQIELLKNSFKDYLIKLEQELQVTIDSNNLQLLFDMFNSNTDLKQHLNRIKQIALKGIEESSNSIEYFQLISSSIDTIGLLDKYRVYYQNIKDTILNMKRNIEYSINSLNTYSHNIQTLQSSIQSTKNEILQLESKLNDTSEFNDIEQFSNLLMKQQSIYTQLKTTLDNILMYHKQLESFNNQNIDMNQVNKINDVIQSIEKITPIFGRDGFVSYLRKSLLKEIATNIGDSLDKFGFLKLIPVTIDEKDGSLMFHNRLFRSLSGGEKTIVAILLRVLYSKLLCPNMKLHLLLLDEPTQNLDPVRITYLRQLLSKINDNLDMQLIVVSHDVECIPENSNQININTDI